MSYAGTKCADTVPMVRSWAVRDAAVSTVNAVVASSIPASSATSRTVRNRSWDQASRLIASAQLADAADHVFG